MKSTKQKFGNGFIDMTAFTSPAEECNYSCAVTTQKSTNTASKSVHAWLNDDTRSFSLSALSCAAGMYRVMRLCTCDVR